MEIYPQNRAVSGKKLLTVSIFGTPGKSSQLVVQL